MNKNRIDTEYVINRYGKVIKYDGKADDRYSLHTAIARKIYPNLEYPKDHIKKMGFVLVGSIVYNAPIIFKKPTQAQINKLDELDLLDSLLIQRNGYMPRFNDLI